MLSQKYNSVRYDYDTEFSCESSGCDSEGICRCGHITNTRVISVDVCRLTDEIYDQFVPQDLKSRKRDMKISQILYGGETVDKYCINRILSNNRAWDVNAWEVNVCGGYYGDEIDDVVIDSQILEKINSQCKVLFELKTISEKIKYVLNLEYGYILDELKDVDFEIVSIYKSDIIFKKLNQNHIYNCKSEDLEHYSEKNYTLPRGIIRGHQDDYKIIDGFHRIIATSDRSKFEVFKVKN